MAAEPVPAQKAPYGVNVEAGKDYWWCACGRSARQPFCDGSHKSIWFGTTKVYRSGDQASMAVRL